MFRQFALVSAGQICLKQFALKGKVHRRALTHMSGEVTAYSSLMLFISLELMVQSLYIVIQKAFFMET